MGEGYNDLELLCKLGDFDLKVDGVFDPEFDLLFDDEFDL
tara:strand:+ start:1311 stop:1430 length:120 start_codon:yes stop_codon:yes gene_type:complete